MLDDEKPKVSLSEPDVPMEEEELVNIEDLTELEIEDSVNEESNEISEEDELRAEIKSLGSQSDSNGLRVIKDKVKQVMEKLD